MEQKPKIPKIKDVWEFNKNICRTTAFLDYFHDSYSEPYPANKRLDCNALALKFFTDCANKPISPWLEIQYEFYGDIKDSIYCNEIAKLALATYKDKWDKLYDIYKIEYDPIHNYLDEWSDEKDSEITKLETDNLTRTDVINSTVSGDKTRTDNLSEVANGNSTSSETTSQTDGKWGFNVASNEGAKPTDNSSSSGSSNTTDTRNTSNTGTQNIESTESTNANNVRTNSGTVSNNDNENTSRSGVHSGNIGNLTSQQQIREEIKLWQWQFLCEVCNDLITLLTLPIYLS